MPPLDGAHSHGPSGHGVNWILVVIVGVLAMLGGGEAATSVIDGLTALLIWLAVVLGLAVFLGAAIVIVALKRRTPDYVRSIHGETERDRILGENARLKREIRAMRDRPEIQRPEYHLHVDAETARQYLTPHPLFNEGPYDRLHGIPPAVM